VQQFYAKRDQRHEQLYKHISQHQDPHTLFITCSDSRILTSLITTTEPGELFIIRNVGNFIPRYSTNLGHSEAAAIEFSLNNLDIKDIIICGHSNCGAIKACCFGDLQSMASSSPELATWINLLKQQISPNHLNDISAAAKNNAMNQIDNLMTYPIVLEKIQNNKLKIHAWFFDFEQYVIYEWSPAQNDFVAIPEAEQLAVL
jgi:carbonic anhydrase